MLSFLTKVSKRKARQSTTCLAVTALSISYSIFDPSAHAETTFRPDVVEEVPSNNGQHWGSWQEALFCEEGFYARGFSMQVEAPMDGDDTALNNIEFRCADVEGNIEDGFPLSPGPGWGEWGNPTVCNRGDFIVGFKLRVEEEQGDGDDTAANDMEVQCSGGAVLTPPNGGPWGEWGDFMYCDRDNSAVCGASLRIEPPIDGDDTALNDVKMYCCSLPAAEEESD